MRFTLCRLLMVARVRGFSGAGASVANAAAPTPATPAKKTESPMDNARKAMDEVGDMKYENKSLNELIEDVKAKSKSPSRSTRRCFNSGSTRPSRI